MSSRSVVCGLSHAPCYQPLPLPGPLVPLEAASCAVGSPSFRWQTLGSAKCGHAQLWNVPGTACQVLVPSSCRLLPHRARPRLSWFAGKQVSPWHDIPLWAEEGKLLNFICEIPKETSAKMEVGTFARLSMVPVKTSLSQDEAGCTALSYASLASSSIVRQTTVVPGLAGLAFAGHVLQFHAQLCIVANLPRLPVYSDWWSG